VHEDDDVMTELQADTTRCWELTRSLLAAFLPDRVDHDAYEAAFIEAAATVGTPTMLRTWSSILWPAMPSSRMDAAAVAEHWDLPADRAWLAPISALMDASAVYGINPTVDNLNEVLRVNRDVLHPACEPQSELWQCSFYWARQLHFVMLDAGGFDDHAGLTSEHSRWAEGQAAMALAPVLALVISTLVAGNHETANLYLSRMIGRGVDPRSIVWVWITGLAELIPASSAWSRALVTEADGTFVSMGTVDGLDRQDDLRTLGVLTRDLVHAVQRGDQAAAAAIKPRVTALGNDAGLRWTWLLANMLSGRIIELTTRTEKT
jgi:hypothetical protein